MKKVYRFYTAEFSYDSADTVDTIDFFASMEIDKFTLSNKIIAESMANGHCTQSVVKLFEDYFSLL